MEGSNQTRSQPNHRPVGGPRDIDAILQRRRQRDRSHHFAPDVLHGSVTVGAIYDALGRQWPEQTVFVDAATDRRGEIVGWSLGTFEDHFLTIQHKTSRDLHDPIGWIADALDGRARLVLRMAADGVPDVVAERLQHLPDISVTRLPCSMPALKQLEATHLDVTRDFSLREQPASDRARETEMRASRLNILSIVGLCTVWTR